VARVCATSEKQDARGNEDHCLTSVSTASAVRSASRTSPRCLIINPQLFEDSCRQHTRAGRRGGGRVNGGEMSGEKGGGLQFWFSRSPSPSGTCISKRGAVEEEDLVSSSTRQVGGKGRQGTRRGSHKRDEIMPHDRQVSGALCVLIVVIQTQCLCV